MKTLLAALALTFGLSGTALAEEWYRLGVAPNHASIVYADAKSISMDGGLRYAWFDTYYDPKQTAPYGAESSQDHDEFDCGAGTIRVVTSIYYKADGSIGKTGAAETEGAPVKPNTVGEAKLLFACTEDHGGLAKAVFTAAAPGPKEASHLYFSSDRPVSAPHRKKPVKVAAKP
jgi:hypothetical protein